MAGGRGRWVPGTKRTLDSNRQSYNNWRTATAGLRRKDARAQLSDFDNCHQEPLALNKDGSKAIFYFAPFDPLHCKVHFSP